MFYGLGHRETRAQFYEWDIEMQVKIEEQRYHTLNMKIDKIFILSIKVSVLEI